MNPASKNFSGIEFGNKAAGFDSPTQLPETNALRRAWQSANKSWWEATPMRYDWRNDIAEQPGSRAYFNEIDQRFLASARKCMHWRNLPFDEVIPFKTLADNDVLEIGVGQGTHAQLIAPHCKSFTGIDLTEHAAGMTAYRFELFNLPGKVLLMDAEDMTFPDSSFDFIWSWGVIHHSADTRRVLQQMHRVLRPGGRAVVMVYYRSWWSFYFCGFLRGIFQNQFKKHGGLHHVTQGATDGAIARFYTVDDWRAVTAGLFAIDAVNIYGLKSEVLPLPHGRLKRSLERLLPDTFARLLTNRLCMGSFLVTAMHKA